MPSQPVSDSGVARHDFLVEREAVALFALLPGQSREAEQGFVAVWRELRCAVEVIARLAGFAGGGEHFASGDD